MGSVGKQHSKFDRAKRKAKYERQYSRTEQNKARHVAKMTQNNPNYPARKDK